ncbi:hypothetical protein D9M68_557180 [compost metagenome]
MSKLFLPKLAVPGLAIASAAAHGALDSATSRAILSVPCAGYLGAMTSAAPVA